ncbi:hypothetical protein [Aureivirga sp. CE67]|uniref:hypothetical protein n=1 Tax=Aureivirga sp. CE67 TaxID=1788983 RepID=UPI0018C9CDA5|nr:hypothetical protein [Aureivirga sp. CE67]
MDYNFYKTLVILADFILAIVIFFGVKTVKEKDTPIKYYLGFLSFYLIVEVISLICKELKMSNQLLFPFYISGEFFFASLFLTSSFKYNLKKWITLFSILILSVSFLIWDVYNYSYINIVKVSSQFSLLIISIMSLVVLLKGTEKNKLYRYKNLILGLLFYYSLSLLMFSVLNQLIKNPRILYLLWPLNIVFLIILYIVSFNTFRKLSK